MERWCRATCDAFEKQALGRRVVVYATGTGPLSPPRLLQTSSRPEDALGGIRLKVSDFDDGHRRALLQVSSGARWGVGKTKDAELRTACLGHGRKLGKAAHLCYSASPQYAARRA